MKHGEIKAYVHIQSDADMLMNDDMKNRTTPRHVRHYAGLPF
jgi:hypothetical protein